MDIDVNEIRGFLQDRNKTQKLVTLCIERLLEKYKVEWGDHENTSSRIEILSTALNSFYPQAINFVYDYSQSEIELDFIQMIQAKQPEWSEERGKRIEDDVVFEHWYGTMMLENGVEQEVFP